MEIGAMLLGRLAVDRRHQGGGIGTRLLIDVFDIALSLRETLGLFAVVVDAIDARAAGYYANFGFTPFADDLHRLYYPLKDYEASLAAARGVPIR
jgi:GNAT superfamily N-acetyltransferase